jgi:cytochrome o ubiquinol oxidase subunit 2
MKLRRQIGLIVLFLAVFVGLLVFLTHGANMAVLNPKGLIAEKERGLIIFTCILGLGVVIPVFVMLFAFAWRYREGNTKAAYTPEWGHSRLFETIWWGIPCAIILVLAVVTWKATHDLDPYKKLASTTAPLKVQVVSLQWKWLFIYPDQKVATVNILPLPEKTPIDFEITSDAPMNSFWIPNLGGQVYAMSGMSTQLHLIADQPGAYNGSSANISGQGFAGMNFTANVLSQHDFDAWVATSQASKSVLGITEYAALARPSKDTPQTTYALTKADLYDTIIGKYMSPPAGGNTVPAPSVSSDDAMSGASMNNMNNMEMH